MNAKSRTLPCSLLTLSVALTARAEDASPPQPDNAITGNAAVASDYMFRGISQTWGGPAVQGGGDVALKNGTWTDHDVFLSGSGPMIRDSMTQLMAAGVSLSRIRFDDFGDPHPDSAAPWE